MRHLSGPRLGIESRQARSYSRVEGHLGTVQRQVDPLTPLRLRNISCLRFFDSFGDDLPDFTDQTRRQRRAGPGRVGVRNDGS